AVSGCLVSIALGLLISCFFLLLCFACFCDLRDLHSFPTRRSSDLSVIATVNIGYADGYDRRFGNGVGYMLVNGAKAQTVGDICMDMTMLDLNNIDASVGDEVIVFDDIEKQATAIGTIPYELLTGISQRVKRVYHYET